MWPATLVHQDREYPCTILDVSELGARIETGSVEFRPDHIVVRCERFGAIEGWLLWSRNCKVGIRFDRAAHDVHQLLKQLVPGMDRKKMSGEAKPQRTPRPHFGRLPRAKEQDLAAPIPDIPAVAADSESSARDSALPSESQ